MGPRPIAAGGFSSMGRKFLMVMTGAAAVGVDTRLPMHIYGRGSMEHEIMFCERVFLTDGIYPEYSCFVKTISEPLDKWEALYSIWQEVKRTDIK